MAEFNLIPPPIHRCNRNQVPLSASQESLWFLHQLAPNSTAYNSIYLFKLKGGVDRQILEHSLKDLFQRHEILRTVYVTDKEGKPAQVIQPFESSKLKYLDYSSLLANEREQTIREYAIQHGSESFDLENGPVTRYTLFHIRPEEDYLFFAVHHIAFDDWSRNIFMQDLIQLYGTYQSCEIPDLPSLPIQFSDHTLWQKNWLSGETLEAFVQHWKNLLSGDLPILALPTDHPRQAAQTYHGSCYRFELFPSLSSLIKKFCRNEHLTPFQVLMAAYAVLLMRYTGQEDILIGCPFANRPRPEQNSLIGYFVNVLPIRLNLAGNPAVRDLLKQVRTVILDAFTWQALPFKTLVTELAPQRDLSLTPVYQAEINMLNVPKRQRSIPGLEMEAVPLDEVSAAFDISLEFSNSGDYFNASAIYNTDLFDRFTIMRMVSHYQNILEEMLTRPDHALSKLEMLSADERQQIMVEWNNTAADYPRDKCIHQLFEEQVERTPDFPAVMFKERQLTYRELNEHANQIAHYLQKMGAGPEIPVGLYLERSAELVVGILGILKAGSPYVPLDTLYPLERRLEIIRDSGMKILVTQDALVNGEFPSGLPLLRLDIQRELLETESTQNPVHAAKPENLVYILYTSGSTGKPKGVEITHRSLVNCLLSLIEHNQLSAGDLSLTVTTPTFDVSVFDFLTPICLGATVVVASRQEVYDSTLLMKRIMELPINWMFATPTTWRMLLDAGWEGKAGLKILSAGETFPPELVSFLLQTCGDVYNTYGPTETTITNTIVRLTPGRPVTIGRPIANTSLYILDSHRKPVPVGVVGEIYIGGDGLARGYHNRPELTAEKFIPDPFSKQPGARLYRTGDLARYRLNGEIDILGRSDFQVKIRGYRIELGEIENVIGQYPEVHQVVVIVREDQPGDKRLVAYIIPVSKGTLDAEELCGFLREKLPDYMIPSAIVFMDSFPLTINGKVDRKALPMPQMGAMENQEYIKPCNQTELILSKIWMNVLGIARVSMGDNFFDIGGNSLSAIRVMMRIRDEFDIAVPVRRIFEFPRLTELAGYVELGLLSKKRGLGSEEGTGEQDEFVL